MREVFQLSVNSLTNACYLLIHNSLSEFNEVEPRLKSAKNWFQLSAGLNLEQLNTILCGTNHI